MFRERDLNQWASETAQPLVTGGRVKSQYATFLDRETVKIDAMISKKARLIELLEEKRTAIISHAVTKGLDPRKPQPPMQYAG